MCAMKARPKKTQRKKSRPVKNLKAALKKLGKEPEEPTDEQRRRWGYEMSIAANTHGCDSLPYYRYYFPCESEGATPSGEAVVYAFPDF
jgi:hypothetical protein